MALAVESIHVEDNSWTLRMHPFLSDRFDNQSTQVSYPDLHPCVSRRIL